MKSERRAMELGAVLKRCVAQVVLTSCAVHFSLSTMAQPSAPQAPPAPPKAWIRAESSVISIVELARFWSGPEKDKLREVSELHPFVLSWWLREGERLSGLKPTDVARLVVSEEWPAGWAVAVETLDAPHTELLRSKLVPDASSAETHHLAYYANEALSLHALDPKTALVALPPAVMEPILARLDAQPDKTFALPPIGGASSALIDVYVRPAGMTGAFDDGTPPFLVPLSKASHVRVAFEPATELTVRLLAHFPDETAARAGVDSLRPLLDQLDKYLEMCEQNMPEAVKRFAAESPDAEKLGPLLDQAIKAARQGVAGAVVKLEGTTASAVVSIQTVQPAADAVLLLSLMPRAAK